MCARGVRGIHGAVCCEWNNANISQTEVMVEGRRVSLPCGAGHALAAPIPGYHRKSQHRPRTARRHRESEPVEIASACSRAHTFFNAPHSASDNNSLPAQNLPRSRLSAFACAFCMFWCVPLGKRQQHLNSRLKTLRGWHALFAVHESHTCVRPVYAHALCRRAYVYKCIYSASGTLAAEMRIGRGGEGGNTTCCTTGDLRFRVEQEGNHNLLQHRGFGRCRRGGWRGRGAAHAGGGRGRRGTPPHARGGRGGRARRR